MISQLTLGTTTFESNLIQAPLAGVSCAPFRELVWQFGGIGYCCTEMLSANNLAHNQDRSPRYYTLSKNEKIIAFQLSTNNPSILAKASEKAIEYGANILDLNCGCPQPKIRKKGCGSRLLTEEKRLTQLIKAMQLDSSVPITIKIRISGKDKEFCERTLAMMIEQTGANGIIVHGRHWTHDYSQPVHLDTIANIVDAVSIPVIGNGDIKDYFSLKKMHFETGCAGFMIGRASVGKPWLFQELVSTHQGKTFIPPSPIEIGHLFLQHVTQLIKIEGEYQAILQSRRFGKYYAKNIMSADLFVQELNHTTELQALIKLVHLYFK